METGTRTQRNFLLDCVPSFFSLYIAACLPEHYLSTPTAGSSDSYRRGGNILGCFLPFFLFKEIQKLLDDTGVEVFSRLCSHDLPHTFRGHARAIGAVRNQGVVAVRDGKNPGMQTDLVARETLGIAGTI